jgi:hypothetical protein
MSAMIFLLDVVMKVNTALTRMNKEADFLRFT